MLAFILKGKTHITKSSYSPRGLGIKSPYQDSKSCLGEPDSEDAQADMCPIWIRTMAHGGGELMISSHGFPSPKLSN